LNKLDLYVCKACIHNTNKETYYKQRSKLKEYNIIQAMTSQ